MEDYIKSIASHGGNIYRAAAEAGLAPEKIIDFSANINPLGVPEEIRSSIIKNIDSLVHYPDPDCMELRAALVNYCCGAVSEEEIVIGNGASEILFLLFDVMKFKKTLIPAPAFSEYQIAASRSGAKVVWHEMKECEGFKLNVCNMLAQLSSDGFDSLVLCNPNNPTSNLIGRNDMAEILDYTERHGIFVILDEAFIEMTEKGIENSMIESILKCSKLFIIRAFTKVFAVPGLRLGYGIGQPALIKEMWERKLPWSVNSLALSIVDFVNNCNAYLTGTQEWLAAEKEWFCGKMREIQGLSFIEPKSCFILAKILKNKISNTGINSEILSNLLSREGILIRNASNFTFLDDSYIRVAIKDRESNIKLLTILKKYLPCQPD